MHSDTRQRINALKYDEHVLGNLNKSVSEEPTGAATYPVLKSFHLCE